MNKSKPKKALVVVDMLNDFVEKDGALCVNNADTIVENIASLIEQARKSDDFVVIYACDNHEEDDVEFKDFPKHCVKKTRGANVIEELKIKDEDYVVRKKTISVFDTKDMDDLLNRLCVKELFICGVATDYCISAAAIGGAKKMYTTVIADAIAGVNETGSYIALIEMVSSGVYYCLTEDFKKKS